MCKEKSSNKAIFIGGCPRSGTTLAMQLLDKHRAIAAFGETKLAYWQPFWEFPKWIHRCRREQRRCLLDVFKKLCLTRFYRFRMYYQMPLVFRILWDRIDRLWLSRFRLFRSTWCDGPVLDILERLWLSESVQCRTFGDTLPGERSAQYAFGMRGLYSFCDQDDVRRFFRILERLEGVDELDDVYRVYGEFWDRLFDLYARRRGKRYWAEKTPPNVLRASFFSRCFENLKVLNIVRDGRDVACSMVRQPWSGKRLVGALDYWGKHLSQTLDGLEGLPNDSYLSVRYEDLVLETELTLRRVTEFLQVDWDSNMLSHPVYKTSIGQYKVQFDARLQEYAQSRWGKLLADWGHFDPVVTA